MSVKQIFLFNWVKIFISIYLFNLVNSFCGLTKLTKLVIQIRDNNIFNKLLNIIN